MIECEHCGEEIESEEAYHEHLRLRHDEMPDTETDGTSWLDREQLLYFGAPIVAVALILVAGAGFVVLGGGSEAPGSADESEFCPEAETQPHDLGSVHFHGTISVSVHGSEHDLARFKYFLEDEYWHLEDPNDEGEYPTWHAHSKNVTLQYGLNSLSGFCAPNSSAVKINGTWYYDDDPGTTVRYLVNGKEVDPRTYVFEAGDEIRVVAESGKND